MPNMVGSGKIWVRVEKNISTVVGARVAGQVRPRLADTAPPNVNATTLVALVTLNAAIATVLPNLPSSTHGP